jgi:ribose 5-phosphate isomerase A
MVCPDRGPASDGSRDRAVRAAAGAALALVDPAELLGVGTGTTVAVFIELLASSDRRPAAAVASSVRTAHLLQAAGIEVIALPESGRLTLYIDGADDIDPLLRLVKGGGGAHTREKVLADAADTFVCIADDSKLVAALGVRPVPVEVLPFARAYATRELREMGGHAFARAGFVSDNGNEVLDVTGLDLTDPAAVESAIDCVAGVLSCGIFALRGADVAFIGHADCSVDRLERP